MKKTDIKTNEFLERLQVVYGEDAALQQERFIALAESFENDFNSDADLRFFSAPGRTEVGGNHTDHNYGCVVAASIDLDIIAVASKREDSVICIKSEGFPEDTVNIKEFGYNSDYLSSARRHTSCGSTHHSVGSSAKHHAVSCICHGTTEVFTGRNIFCVYIVG